MMTRKFILAFTACFIVYILCQSCGQNTEGKRPPMSPVPKALLGEKIATFAEGCFWHSELVFQSLEGVREVISGYAGGHDPEPFYESVCTGKTGHAEAVQVYYDPSKISYETLVKAFFASHDPTSLNRQGQDVGTEYRSIAFYRSEEEKQIISNEMARLSKESRFANKIVTEVMPIQTFYPAEEFHQEYVSKHLQNEYVKYVCIPEFLTFKMSFEAKYKTISYIDY